MTPSVLTASRDYMGYLTPVQIKSFYANGYYILRSPLEDEKVKLLDSLVSKLLQDATQMLLDKAYSGNSEKMTAKIFSGIEVVYKRPTEDKIAFSRLVGCAPKDSLLSQLLLTDKLVITFMNALNCDKVEHIITSLHPKEPNDGVQFSPHYDGDLRKNFDPNWDVTADKSYMVAIIAIDKMSYQNGGLNIYPSSYVNGQRSSETVEEILNSDEGIYVDMNPGDILFMHPNLLHASAANCSNDTRRALILGFCREFLNSAQYPGANVNNVFNLQDDLSIKDYPATHLKTTSGQELNH